MSRRTRENYLSQKNHPPPLAKDATPHVSGHSGQGRPPLGGHQPQPGGLLLREPDAAGRLHPGRRSSQPGVRGPRNGYPVDVHSAPRSQRSEPAPGMRDDETRFSDRDRPLPHESTKGCAPTRLLVAHTFLPLKDKVAQSATRAPATAPPAPATPGANRPPLLRKGLKPGSHTRNPTARASRESWRKAARLPLKQTGIGSCERS